MLHGSVTANKVSIYDNGLCERHFSGMFFTPAATFLLKILALPKSLLNFAAANDADRHIFYSRKQDKTIRNSMIIVPVKDNNSIERALKQFKRKFDKTGIGKELRRRQQFDKPSVKKRLAKEHAVYVTALRRSED